jgi:hypothetical protein
MEKNMNYFTDREFGTRPAAIDVIDARLWGGLHTLITNRINDSSFGYLFPEYCSDGEGPCGCDAQAFGLAISAEIPSVDWPLSLDLVPATPVILDLLEFCANAVGQKIEGSYHSYMRHYHLSWDKNAGLISFVADVNRLFVRNALGFQLTPEGKVQRLLPQPIADTLRWTLFTTEDAVTNQLLEEARTRIVSPKPGERQIALEKLWDAFERLKTLEPGSNKKTQAEALLNRMAPQSSFLRTTLDDEAAALTKIGNNFLIRHSERDKEALTTIEQVDYFFWRMFAFIRLILKATGRGG